MRQLQMDCTLDPDSFRAIARLAYSESGLTLVEEKLSMIQSRLRHRLRALDLADFAVYSSFVCSDAGQAERRHMISALTTNVSHFFRERHHFVILAGTILRDALPRLRTGGRLRLWSAGCSNGQEACSMAMTLLETAPEVADLDLRILATDIDPNVVAFAKEGRYAERLVAGIDKALLTRYFQQATDAAGTVYVATPALRSMIRYRELNLLSDWPMRNAIDVIFCRNVVIYFDQVTQNRLWPRFRTILSPDGWLFVGHSERITDPEAFGFQIQGPTAYRPSDARCATPQTAKGKT